MYLFFLSADAFQLHWFTWCGKFVAFLRKLKQTSSYCPAASCWYFFCRVFATNSAGLVKWAYCGSERAHTWVQRGLIYWWKQIYVCYQKEWKRQLNHAEYPLGRTEVEFGFAQNDSSKERLHSSDLVNSNSSWPLWSLSKPNCCWNLTCHTTSTAPEEFREAKTRRAWLREWMLLL